MKGVFGTGNIDSRFHVLSNMFVIIGTPLFPVEGSRIYSAYRVLVYVVLCLTFVTVLIGISKNLDDMAYVMESARPGLAMFNVMWSHFFMRLQNVVKMATCFTWSELPTRDPDTGNRTLAASVARSQVLAWRVANLVILSHVLYLILRILTKNANPVFFNAWFPFDLDNILGYSFVLILQGYGSVILANILFGFMSLYAVLVAVGCTQLEKVQITLLDLKQVQDEPHSEMRSRFVLCVQHHQQVLRYMRALEEMFHVMLIGPFLSVGVTLCFAAFTALTLSGNLEESVQIFLVIFAFMCQIQVFCWFGNELTEQSGRVQEAVCWSDWIGSSISHQRCIVIMMTVTREFTLTAGKIIPASRHTMMTVLNQTYSFLMFLLNFMERSTT